MHIRSLILATLAASALMVMPSHALSLQDVYEQLGGLDCSGNTCTESETITTAYDNPDISTDVLVAPATSEGPGGETASKACLTETIFGNPIPEDRLAFFCTGNNSLSPLRGSNPARFATVVTDGGTTIVDTCSTTTHTVIYNGPHTSRDTAWSIDSETSESDGAC